MSPVRAFAPALAAALLLAASPGCYLLHVTGGQLGILAGRVPLADVIADPATDAETRAELALVRDARAYAAEVIGLEVGGSYTTFYDTGGGPVIWQVSACEALSFAPYVWEFPLVGALPYKGWFEREPAEAERSELAAEGLDALLLPVPAYSTLGWFDDPLYSSLLDDPPDRLVETVIHELTHATVFVDDDAAFNETLATFVGQAGARAFFAARGDEAALAAMAARLADERVFTDAVGELHRELWRIFEVSGRRARLHELKRAAYVRFQARFEAEARPRLNDPAAYGWLRDEDAPLDNALVLALQRYHGDLALFEALHDRCGRDLARTIARLVELAGSEHPRAALEALVD